MPRLQRLQRRMSGPGRYSNLQIGIPVALLRKAFEASFSPHDGANTGFRACRIYRAGRREFLVVHAALRLDRKADLRRSSKAALYRSLLHKPSRAGFERTDASTLKSQDRRTSSCGRIHLITTFTQTSRRRRPMCCGGGFNVIVPDENLCCGRPLYDWGMIEKARSHLTEILSVLRRRIETARRLSSSSRAARSCFMRSL